MNASLVRLNLILLVSAAFVSTEVAVENGGYSVLVSFSQNVHSEDGLALLENLKASLQDVSEILHAAIGLQFSEVKFKIPTSWDTSEWNITTEDFFNSRSFKPDFLIDNTNDNVFGKFPFAQQYGSCGTPGHQIVVPTAFFDEANGFPKGISLAREWLKYRYGVFDENGYFSDPLYPLYYITPGSDTSEVKITECTNAQLEYEFIDQNNDNCSTSDKTLIERLNSGECKIQVDEENSENVTSSFMYFQKDFSFMQHICGRDSDHQHNSRSPNKQNALCYGRSIWDIVKKSSDFQSEKVNKEYSDIKYTYVQETKPKVVVAWENTAKLKSKGSAILNAIYKFIIDLPNGSKFSAIPFKNIVPQKDYTLNDLNGMDDKKSIIADISSDFVISENGNVNTALVKAVDILKLSVENISELEGTIIIIARRNETPDETAIRDMLKDLNICVKIIYFSEDAISGETYSFASSCPALDIKEFSLSDTNEETFEKLFETMETILPSKIDDKAIETVQTSFLTQDSPIAFEVDDSVETVTFWVFSKKESDNFQLTLNGEEKKTGVTSETFGNIVALSYSPTQPGKIEFRYPHETDPMLTQVRITSKVGKYFNGEVLVHDTTGESADQMPVVIYAIIRFGAYPVQNAKVSAIIKAPSGNDFELALNDDGRGDPDITQNDGVYSRYFISFSEEGEYAVTVTVQNNDYLTTYGADKNAGYQTCCGSYVNGDTSKFANGFSKVFRSTFKAKSARPEDGYKPSRISDLRIDQVTDDKIILKWSAPGGEADSGTAQSYEIKYFTSQEDAMNNFDRSAILNYTTSPKENGETEMFEISFNDFEKIGLYYIAIKAKNANKTSDLSNTIEVFIPEQKTTDSPDEVTDDSVKNVKSGTANPRTIKIIIGVIVGVMLLVIVTYLVVYFCVVKPKRKKEGKDNPIYESSTRVDNNALNPISFVSADTLIKHHNEKTKAKLENKEPPIFKEEDFEDRNSMPTSETAASNNHAQQPLESTNKTSSNEPPMPPKSPKRTTFV